MQELSKPVLLFDGVCTLCNGIVRFVIRRDPQGKFLFASLQSDPARELLVRFGLPVDDMESFVLIDGDRCSMRSEAWLRTLKMIGWPWKALYVFILVPRPIRDAIYDLVARYRYRIFGKRETCMVPTPDIRSRFLE